VLQIHIVRPTLVPLSRVSMESKRDSRFLI
jgi:hypothetical protein